MALGVLIGLVLAIALLWRMADQSSDDVGVAQGELMGSAVMDAPPGQRTPFKAASAVPAERPPAKPEADGGASEAGMAQPSGEAGGEELDSLLQQADEAYDAGELYQALPLYKEAAVRLQVALSETEADAERARLETTLQEIQALVRESEAGIRAERGDVVPDLENRTPHAPPVPGEVRELTIRGLGNFPYDDEAGGVPDDIAALDGSQVRLTGYMLPGFQMDQIRQFSLVEDVYECCFGEPPGVEHIINVVLPEGRAVTFTYGEVQVTGTLRVREDRREGFVVNLFTIEDVTSVRATGRQ